MKPRRLSTSVSGSISAQASSAAMRACASASSRSSRSSSAMSRMGSDRDHEPSDGSPSPRAGPTRVILGAGRRFPPDGRDSGATAGLPSLLVPLFRIPSSRIACKDSSRYEAIKNWLDPRSPFAARGVA